MEQKDTSRIFPSLCLCRTKFIYHMTDFTFEPEIFILQPGYRCRCLACFCRKLHGNLMILVIYHIQVIHDTFSTDHGHADSFMEIFYGKDLDRTDLSCMCDMRSTTCTEIRTRETHKTHLTGKFLFASVGQFFQFFFWRIKNFYRSVLPYFLICLRLNLSKLCLCQNPAEIYCDHITAHMKSHIVISICLMHQSTDNMLSGMLLHQIKPSGPVNFSCYLASGFQRFLCIMNNLTSLFLYIHNGNSI